MTQNYKPAYPPEFRQQMAELVALGKCPKQLSKEFGCHYTSIQTWCRAAGVPINQGKPGPISGSCSMRDTRCIAQRLL
ncbi:hypothetical protein C8R28_10592 [Nitrosomonas ureae]|uniref:Transposase n=1 Tax=Nitrosomonas ureae TaxID=44577 RepID=A0A2T5I5A3_9PROT|nr:hypothetical protein C8R28_10592 [Nitrosomonas ureae]